MHLRPWEVRRLRFPSEFLLALQPDRYDSKKPPPGAEAVGHAAVMNWWLKRRQKGPPTAAEMLARERAKG